MKNAFYQAQIRIMDLYMSFIPARLSAAILLGIFLFSYAFLCAAGQRYSSIEDFESGQVNLISYSDQDLQPNAWELISTGTYQNSAWSLRLYGNVRKQQMISPVVVDSHAVFQVAAKCSYGAQVQGIGFSDGQNALFYSFSGTQIMDLETWIPVYQGAFTAGVWNEYKLPIADDWYAFFDYLPLINSLLYINDTGGGGQSNFWLDNIYNISDEITLPPQVSVSYQITNQGFKGGLNRQVGVQFYSQVIDDSSVDFSYEWDFGDGETSENANPYHTYTVNDAHPYRATLKVINDSGKWGLASALVEVDTGESSLPLRMNFVGDIMLARRYEQGGGIIPTQGVNAIFAPTLNILGNAADITVANLEVALTNRGQAHPTKSVVYRGNPNNVSGLVYAGIDKVCLANNHTLDYGLPGILQTMEVLDDNGIIHSGAGADSYAAYTPAFINTSGLNIAFLASSDRTGQYNNAQPYLHAGYNKFGFAYMTPYYIGQQIQAVEGVADLIIVEMHGGSEYSLTPGSGYDKYNPFWGDDEDEDYSHRTDVPHMWDIAIRHHAIDAGADLVIVHHPHIIQGLELYEGKVIVHSLGNFIFDLDYPETMPSMIFYADADHSGFSRYQVRPVFIDNYIPVAATGKLGRYILDYLAMRSTELNTKLMIDYQNLVATALTDDFQAELNTQHFTQNVLLSPDGSGWQESGLLTLPRFGSITSVDGIEPVQDGEYRMGSECVWFGNFEDDGCSLWEAPEYEYRDSLEGARSARLQPAAGQNLQATFKRRCKLYDNSKKYTLHGWMKTSNVASANIQIRFYSTRTSPAVYTEYITANLSGNNEWQFFAKELMLPSSAWYYDISLMCANSGGHSGYALFDKVGLMEWTPWTAVAERASIPHPNNYYYLQLRTAEIPKSLNLHFTEQSYTPYRENRSVASALQPHLKSYPNPFRSELKIDFEADGKAPVQLAIYNLRGQKVRELISGEVPKGKHQISWDGKDQRGKAVAAGVFIVKYSSGPKSAMRKVIYLR
ncbi:MAG: CapA family protein [Candidatus Cloacimonadaceae bacterium]